MSQGVLSVIISPSSSTLKAESDISVGRFMGI